MQYNRKMGIDFGDKRIGVALTDLLGMLSSAYEVVQNDDIQKTLNHLTNLAKEKSVNLFVLGLPLNMNGEENERTRITRDFGQKLENFSKIKVVFEDERLSSVEGEEILKEKHLDWKKRKEVLDMYSAQVILQSYLNQKK